MKITQFFFIALLVAFVLILHFDLDHRRMLEMLFLFAGAALAIFAARGLKTERGNNG